MDCEGGRLIDRHRRTVALGFGAEPRLIDLTAVPCRRVWTSARIARHAMRALAGPPVCALGTALVSGRGTSLTLPLLVVAVVAPSLAGFGLLAWRRRRRALVAAGEFAMLLAFLSGFAPVAAPSPVTPFRFSLPAARPPAAMSMQHMVTGVIRRTAAFAYRGGSFADLRTFTMNAVLVRHPAGGHISTTQEAAMFTAMVPSSSYPHRATHLAR
jgi:hypothetical protein